MEKTKKFRVVFQDYGDGYEEFETLAEAEKAMAEWEREYGAGAAYIACEDGNE